jgi:hypothetical protein
MLSILMNTPAPGIWVIEKCVDPSWKSTLSKSISIFRELVIAFMALGDYR